MAVKVLDENGSGQHEHGHRRPGLVRPEQGRARNIRVINLSLGHRPGESYKTDPLCAAVRRAVQAGIVVVAPPGTMGRTASGNIVYGGISSPGQRARARSRWARSTPSSRTAPTTRSAPTAAGGRPSSTRPGEAGRGRARQQDHLGPVDRVDAR